MNSLEQDGARSEDSVRDVAARWVVRQDRRLSAAEERELEAWLAADPRHAAAYEKSRASWQQFRRIGQAARRAEPIERPRADVRPWIPVALLAAAAVVLLAIYAPRREAVSPAPQQAGEKALAQQGDTTPRRTRQLPDGTLARVSGATELTEAFTSAERRVKFSHGTVYFVVEKDAERPFIVQIGDITVRAVGTAFNVQADAARVDVLVTEGTVHVNPAVSRSASHENAASAAPAVLVAGQRAVVTHASAARAPKVVLSSATAAELRELTASHATMLELAGATLGELVAGFTQRSQQRIELGEPELATVRIGGRVPQHDVDGFLRALETLYDVKREVRSDGVIVLRKGP